MPSIKNLKRDVNLLTYDLISECFTYKSFHPEKNKETDKVILEIIALRNDLVHRINNPEDKNDSKKLKAHYNKINVDLAKLVKEVEDLSKDG